MNNLLPVPLLDIARYPVEVRDRKNKNKSTQKKNTKKNRCDAREKKKSYNFS
jgi:hypothetical protein